MELTLNLSTLSLDGQTESGSIRFCIEDAKGEAWSGLLDFDEGMESHLALSRGDHRIRWWFIDDDLQIVVVWHDSQGPVSGVSELEMEVHLGEISDDEVLVKRMIELGLASRGNADGAH
jgi:hypothetical protein